MKLVVGLLGLFGTLKEHIRDAVLTLDLPFKLDDMAVDEIYQYKIIHGSLQAHLGSPCYNERRYCSGMRCIDD